VACDPRLRPGLCVLSPAGPPPAPATPVHPAHSATALHVAPPFAPLLPLRPPQLRPTRTRRSRCRCRHSPGSPLPVCGVAEQGPILCAVLGAAVALWCSGSTGAPVCTATGGVGFGGGGATGSGRRCRCGSRRSTRSGGRCGCCCCCHTVQWSHAVPGTSRHTHTLTAASGGSHTPSCPFQLPTACPWYAQTDALRRCCCCCCCCCTTQWSRTVPGWHRRTGHTHQEGRTSATPAAVQIWTSTSKKPRAGRVVTSSVPARFVNTHVCRIQKDLLICTLYLHALRGAIEAKPRQCSWTTGIAHSQRAASRRSHPQCIRALSHWQFGHTKKS
jgi:hypothetical protein